MFPLRLARQTAVYSWWLFWYLAITIVSFAGIYSAIYYMTLAAFSVFLWLGARPITAADTVSTWFMGLGPAVFLMEAMARFGKEPDPTKAPVGPNSPLCPVMPPCVNQTCFDFNYNGTFMGEAYEQLKAKYWYYFVMGVIGLILICQYRILYKTLIRVAMRTKGVYIPEAVMQGSSFIPTSDRPGCQFEVYRAGIMTDTFVGFGIRVAEEFVAIPTHVYEMAMKNGPVIIRKNDKSEYSANIRPYPVITTTTVNDLLYVKVDHKILMQMGLKIARFPANGLEGLVEIAGRDGKTTGFLKRHMTKGMMVYGGSTKPGYSGAPYTIGNLVYGIHTGSLSSTQNIGISFVVLVADLSRLFQLNIIEAEGSISYGSSGPDVSLEIPLANPKQKQWNPTDLLQDETNKVLLKEYVFKSGNWADQAADEYGWESALGDIQKVCDQMPASCLETIDKYVQYKLSQGTVLKNVKTQGNEENFKDIECKNPYEIMTQNTLVKVQKLERNLAALIDNLEAEDSVVKGQFVDLKHKVEMLNKRVDHSCGALEQRIDNVQAEVVQFKEQIKEQLTNTPEKPQKKKQKVLPFGCPKEGCDARRTHKIALIHHWLEAHKGEELPYLELHALEPIEGETIELDNVDTTTPSKEENFRVKASPPKKLPSSNNTSYSSRARPKYSFPQRPHLKMESTLALILTNLEKLSSRMDGQNLDTTPK